MWLKIIIGLTLSKDPSSYPFFDIIINLGLGNLAFDFYLKFLEQI